MSTERVTQIDITNWLALMPRVDRRSHMCPSSLVEK